MKKLILSLVMMIVCLAASAQKYVYSCADDGYTNIRSANSTNARIIGELNNRGGAAIYMQTSGNWYKINYNGIIGYVHKSQVFLDDYAPKSTPKASASSSSRMVYSAASDGYTNIRKGAGTNYAIVGELVNGQAGAKYISASGKWYKVNFNGVIGYVHSSQVKLK